MRSGNSLRMHSRIAVDAVIGSSPRIPAAAGSTATTGSAAKRMMRNPITAFQNPTTIHGRTTANSAKIATSTRPMPPGDSAIAIRPSIPIMVTAASTPNSTRRPVTLLTVGGVDGFHDLQGRAFQHAGYDFRCPDGSGRV